MALPAPSRIEPVTGQLLRRTIARLPLRGVPRSLWLTRRWALGGNRGLFRVGRDRWLELQALNDTVQRSLEGQLQALEQQGEALDQRIFIETSLPAKVDPMAVTGVEAVILYFAETSKCGPSCI